MNMGDKEPTAAGGEERFMRREETHVRFHSGQYAVDSIEVSAAKPRAELPEALPVALALPGERETSALDPLGEPISIGAVARILGCSVWTVRQRFLPAGLPHLRLGRKGTLHFFRHQVVQWILRHQQLHAITPRRYTP